MLDTFIIERIRKEREREREIGRQPLRIERRPPSSAPRDLPEEPETTEERGSVVIDFSL